MAGFTTRDYVLRIVAILVTLIVVIGGVVLFKFVLNPQYQKNKKAAEKARKEGVAI